MPSPRRQSTKYNQTEEHGICDDMWLWLVIKIVFCRPLAWTITVKIIQFIECNTTISLIYVDQVIFMYIYIVLL